MNSGQKNIFKFYSVECDYVIIICNTQLRMVKLWVTEISKQHLELNMRIYILQFSSHSTLQLKKSLSTNFSQGKIKPLKPAESM